MHSAASRGSLSQSSGGASCRSAAPSALRHSGGDGSSAVGIGASSCGEHDPARFFELLPVRDDTITPRSSLLSNALSSMASPWLLDNSEPLTARAEPRGIPSAAAAGCAPLAENLSASSMEATFFLCSFCENECECVCGTCAKRWSGAGV